jgi:protein-disulfide isomerase/uncharacterized membrane protein
MDPSQLTTPSLARAGGAADAPRLSPDDARTLRLVYGVLVVLTTVGLAASAALLVDYLRPMPLFCSESGGCGQLRQSAYAHIGSIPMPAFGVAGYLVMGALLLARGDVARLLHLVAASLGAFVAALLLYLQVRLSTYCAYCMTVDLTSIALFGVVLMRVKLEADGPKDSKMAFGVAGLFIAAVGVPFVSNALIKTPVPEVIAKEIAQTPPGQVTVVDFIDFECPYCRETAADFQPILDQYRGKVRVVRKQMPLFPKHPHSLVAAQAACCAEQMGKGDEMADKLISMPVPDLTEDGCASAAVGLGLDDGAFRTCMRSPATQKQIDADAAEFKAAHGHALPTIWIGKQKIEGAEGAEALRKAMEKAIAEVGG